MNDGFGIEIPPGHNQGQHRKPARYLVVIDAGGSTIAQLFLDTREIVAEFDAGAEEVSLMTAGLLPAEGAEGEEWDRALEGHSAEARGAAKIYTLDL